MPKIKPYMRIYLSRYKLGSNRQRIFLVIGIITLADDLDISLDLVSFGTRIFWLSRPSSLDSGWQHNGWWFGNYVAANACQLFIARLNHVSWRCQTEMAITFLNFLKNKSQKLSIN